MSERRKYVTVWQRQPLKVPAGWSEEERRFVEQLEEVLDDIYRRFGRIRLKDLSPELRAMIEPEEEGDETP